MTAQAGESRAAAPPAGARRAGGDRRAVLAGACGAAAVGAIVALAAFRADWWTVTIPGRPVTVPGGGNVIAFVQTKTSSPANWMPAVALLVALGVVVAALVASHLRRVLLAASVALGALLVVGAIATIAGHDPTTVRGASERRSAAPIVAILGCFVAAAGAAVALVRANDAAPLWLPEGPPPGPGAAERTQSEP